MAKGAKKKGGGGGGQSRGGAKKPTGIEKYGKDAADDYLDLSGSEAASEAESDVCEEEDVMAIDEEEDEPEDYAPPKRAVKAKALAVGSDDDEDKLAPASSGWRRNEFYGGDDAGDDSDENSDEDLVFQEAKRLEELRAKQLSGGEDDVLAALLAPSADVDDQASPAEASVRSAGAVATNAHFESVFAAEAETVSMPRDMSELPAAERRGLLKKEAPELMPLLSDFKTKLAGLRELLPLLRSPVLKRLPASGRGYVEAKAALMLNTLANLSFYLLLRAEGGAVRAHPVIPQLVWLRELHEQLAPLDEKLSPKVRKALAGAKEALQASSELGKQSPKEEMPRADVDSSKRPEVRRKRSLRERLERVMPATSSTAKIDRLGGAPKEKEGVRIQGLLTKDLLKLPKIKASNSGSAFAPADLDDIDPSLGVWAPRSTLGEQISSVQQQMKEHATRDKAASASADQNTEARPRKAAKERGERHKESDDEEPLGEDEAAALDAEIDGGDDDEDNELIKGARALAKLKKAKRQTGEAQRAEHKEEQRRLKEFRPENEADGRRKTSKKILNNRGLARQRKKHAGNARVSNKNKYEKAVKNRKGAVQEVREGAADGATYGGEETGLRTHVRKSIKIGETSRPAHTKR